MIVCFALESDRRLLRVSLANPLHWFQEVQGA
jgi:hypothetical protein